MNKITQKKINLDLVLKDVEKYCFSELSFEKIKNLEYITNFDKLVEVHKGDMIFLENTQTNSN